MDTKHNCIDCGDTLITYADENKSYLRCAICHYNIETAQALNTIVQYCDTCSYKSSSCVCHKAAKMTHAQIRAKFVSAGNAFKKKGSYDNYKKLAYWSNRLSEGGN